MIQKEQAKKQDLKSLKKNNIKHKRTSPYSPWQNGIVERSHRIDNECFIRRNDLKVIEKWKNHLIDTQIDITT